MTGEAKTEGPDFGLRGTAALITGASGGLGAHFAHVLARAGAAVALAARRTDKLDDQVCALTDAGHRAVAVALDVTDSASIDAGFRAAEAALGPIGLLVNNSGISPTAPALDFDEAEWGRVIDTNLTGAFLCSRRFARPLIAAGRPGVIVNIASILAERVASHVSPYIASKAGLAHLTRALALEWARHDIRVNALAPGYVETDMNRDFFATAQGAAKIKQIAQRRLGLPADLDGPLLLLASPASSFMTGSTIVVDGGHLLSSL